MTRTLVIGLALFVLTAATAPKPAASPAPNATSAKSASAGAAVKTVADAPADEYFGPFKYSAISTRMKINALARSYNERWSDDASIVHDAQMVQSSLESWAQKYPKDRWLAPTAFHLAQLYMNVQTNDARAHARAMFAYVAKTYPNTKEGHLARLRLHEGFPALHAEAPVSPTPSPYGPKPDASSAPGASPAPAGPAAPSAPSASTVPAAGATPAVTPAPAPAATPAPAGATSPSTAAPASPKPSAKPR